MPRKYNLALRVEQEPIRDHWLKASEQFFGRFSPEILKCITGRRFGRPKTIPAWSMQDHEAMADTLWKLREGLMTCLTAGWRCWPLKSPEIKGLERMLRSVDRARSNLEELMYCQHRAEATTFVYYGRGRREWPCVSKPPIGGAGGMALDAIRRFVDDVNSLNAERPIAFKTGQETYPPAKKMT